jgi:hypothetical protein
MAKPRVADPKAIRAFGLTQIYTPRDDPTIDIVFVHGLNGHPHDSWTSKSTGCFWPTDLLPDVLASLRPRILTYGYNANVTAFTDGASRDSVVSHAETLASNLAANRNVSVAFRLFLTVLAFCGYLDTFLAAGIKLQELTLHRPYSCETAPTVRSSSYATRWAA